MEHPSPIRLGVSACLLGQPVRYDGGHKLDHFVRDILGPHVEFVPVCPEAEAGLGIPREAMRLAGDPADPRLVTITTKRDLTPVMKTWAAARVEALAAENLSGFILKSRSPSSGMARVKVYPEKGGQPAMTGVGLFARALMDRLPTLPVEEEGRLNDLALRENFIERLFVRARWLAVLASPRPAKALLDFHTRHKLLVRAHSLAILRELGTLTAQAAGLDPADLLPAYESRLMEALRLAATPKKNRDVLEHILGYFKRVLPPDEKQEFLELIAAYAEGHLPLIVPVTLANHFVRKYREPYLASQYYLNPHPLELKLRNHA
jgi:uncharacterized protein YbgA (DUF1722 family)/uncharacterized protein YbbK (DUF523 family)